MTQVKKPTAGSIELPNSKIAPAIRDLASHLEVADKDIQVLRAIPVVWNDGAVGCPKPDMYYTQSLVPGFWVVLGHDNRLYSYHASRNGPLKLCENARPNPVGAPPKGRYDESV